MSEESTKEIMTPECGFFLNEIYFYLTEGCNLKCRHCWIVPKFQTEEAVWPSISFDQFVYIVEQGKKLGMSGVKLTGGEPLIHPEIDRILDYLSTQDLRVTIETNGVKLTQARVEKIRKCTNPFVSVSLDGSEKEEHEWVRGVEGCYEDALEGARNLVKGGIRNQFIMSIMKRNVHQMEDLVRLAEKMGIGSIKFNLVTPTARGEALHKAGETLSIVELIKLGDWVENELQPSTKLRLHYSHPIVFRPFSKIFSDVHGKCGIFGIIGVLGSGKYALCGIGETVPELVFGHVDEDKLRDVWNNSDVLNDIRNGLPNELSGICGDCLLKSQCLGSCIAMNYYRHHDLFAPFWYCEEAFNSGLFPETRIKPGSKTEVI